MKEATGGARRGDSPLKMWGSRESSGGGRQKHSWTDDKVRSWAVDGKQGWGADAYLGHKKDKGFWPSEKDLVKWIQLRWKPKGHVDLKLGAKGFFTVIFANLEDKERIFEEGPYFMNNAGLFMRHWEERYNPDAEKLLAAPIWVRLFGLPTEFWHPEILEGIGNSIGAFVKVAETTKRGKFTSYARICVYMNIEEPLPEYVEVEYHDEIWQHPIDYEHIPFRCRRCHEYDHLFRECP
eukprot:PITA_20851